MLQRVPANFEECVRPRYANEEIEYATLGQQVFEFAIRKAEERGIECRWIINSEDMNEWESKIDENTRFVYGEMPSNPGQAFFDLDH